MRVGVIDGSDAAVGEVGEYLESIVPVGSAISLVNNVQAQITQLLLSPGDWDIYGGGAIFTDAATTLTLAYLGLSDNGTSINLYAASGAIWPSWTPGIVATIPCSGTPMRISQTVNKTVWLMALGQFSAGTLKAFGELSARRVR